MRIIFIRHGDPDYKNDSLTEKGRREAELLAERVMGWKDEITHIYRSPLGRAKLTCEYSLNKLHMDATECEWLKEFYYPTHHAEQNNEIHVPWDFYPAAWTDFKEAYDKDKWAELSLLHENDIKGEADHVNTSFDKLLEEYGLKRNGEYYLTDGSDHGKTLVFFCHLGVSFLIMGHLLGISPFVLWHSFFVAPTAVTVLATEEREPGKCAFRTQYFGDTSHLRLNGEPASKSGYFTDCFQG